MASMTFQINDASTSSVNPAVWVTITENANGTLSISVTQVGGVVGDLRGLFFDLNDESITNSLTVSGANTTEFRTGDDSIRDLGDGANMNGLLGGDRGYDAGIEIGSAGIGSNDIGAYSFTLSSSVRPLTLQDFANVDFGVRLTSVGTIDGSRADSSKIMEQTFAAINAQNDSASVDENDSDSGNVLDNDRSGLAATDIVSVTGWSGGALGATVELANAEGATLQLNADGSYVLDASAADALSEGEHLTYSFTYDARNQNEATSWASDGASFTITVNGANDGPQAGDDSASAIENASPATGTVLANDDDIDRLDTISVAGWSGGALGDTVAIDNGAGATLQLNADGGYALDASSADALSEGETITQDFTYALADNHGATDGAVLSVTVNGVNDGPIAEDDNGGRAAENGTLAGDVTGNDSDIDRLDTHTWSLASFDGLGNLTFNEDGTWSYSAGGAYDHLNDGEQVELSFQYQMADNHGGTDTATVSFSIDGAGTITSPPPTVDTADVFLFNHGSNEFDHGWFPQLRDNTAEGFDGNDILFIAGDGSPESMTVSSGNYGYGSPSLDDTMFVLDYIERVRGESTLTEDVGYLVDYDALTAEQIVVAGNFNEATDLFFA